MKYWLMKTEPSTYSIDDLLAEPGQTDHWDGVRNYQARNFMRDEMQPGDKVLLYHSGKHPAVVGTAVVVREGYPDHTAWDPESDHFDPKSRPDTPTWYMVDVRCETKFTTPLPLKHLRGLSALSDMWLLRRGMRLSIQPVTAAEYEAILSLAESA
ncbi:MAG: EVE domain-containing protein [Desulfosarcinaceae bacterium]|nr:EVE domain-containing protein [Desulfosarcinaceae bacterium]